MSKRCVPIKDSICDDQLRTCIECNSVDISHIFALRWFNARDKNMSGNGAQWMLKKKKKYANFAQFVKSAEKM